MRLEGPKRLALDKALVVEEGSSHSKSVLDRGRIPCGASWATICQETGLSNATVQWAFHGCLKVACIRFSRPPRTDLVHSFGTARRERRPCAALRPEEPGCRHRESVGVACCFNAREEMLITHTRQGELRFVMRGALRVNGKYSDRL